MSLNNMKINDKIEGVVSIWRNYTKRKITKCRNKREKQKKKR